MSSEVVVDDEGWFLNALIIFRGWCCVERQNQGLDGL